MAPALTRERIVREALDLLDEAGIDGLTLRVLAARLGVKAPALYWHFRDKKHLLDEMGTLVMRQVLEEVSAQAPPQQWRDGLRGYASALRRGFLAHRDGARTFSGTRLTDPELLRLQEPWLAHWTGRGVPLGRLVAGAELVTAFVVGFVIEEQERSQADPAAYDLANRDAAVGPDAPLVAQAGRVLFADPDSRFATYLDAVIAGLASLPAP